MVIADVNLPVSSDTFLAHLLSPVRVYVHGRNNTKFLQKIVNYFKRYTLLEIELAEWCSNVS